MSDADHPEGKVFTFDAADLNDGSAIFRITLLYYQRIQFYQDFALLNFVSIYI